MKITRRISEGIANALDGVVMAIAPERGARRVAMREMLASAERQIKNYHEAAANDRLRGGKWLGSQLSPNSGLEEDLQALRDRSSELYRSDSVGGAIDDMTNHVVGRGPRLQAKIGPPGQETQPINRKIEKAVRRWSRRCGRDGRSSLTNILRQCVRSDGYHGDGFILLSNVSSVDRIIPLALEVIDADRVGTPENKVNDPLCRLGIQHDAGGAIVGYWIRDAHPHDTVDYRQSWTLYEAHRVLHFFDAWYAGQLRGYPWMSRSLTRLKDAKDLDEAAILTAQIGACFSAFITTNGNTLAGAVGAATSTTSAGDRLEDIQPGRITRMAGTEDIKFGQPAQPGSSYGPFQEWIHRRAAAGMNWSYEMLCKNWSGTSHAGGRLVLTNTRLDLSVRQGRLEEQVLCPLYERVLDQLVAMDYLGAEILRAYASDPDEFQDHAWIHTAWPYSVNPGEESKADIALINNNIKSRAEVVASYGGDIEEVDEARRTEREREEGYKIVPPDVMKAQPVEAPQDQTTGAAA